MAMFNFVSKPQPKLDEIIKNLTTMIGPQMVTAPQAGPVMPGESLPAITAMQEGTGKATIDQIKALAGLATSRAPGIAQVGTNQIASLMAGPETLDPTNLMRHLEAAGYIQGTPEYQAAMRDVLMKPQVAINQGSKMLGADAKNWMNPQTGEKPPATTTIEGAVASGFVPMTTEEQKTAGAAQSAAPLVSSLALTAFGKKGEKSLFPSKEKSALERAQSGFSSVVADITESDPRTVLYNRTKESFVSQLARLSGQVGTLTDRDVDLVRGLFPRAGFTPEPIAKDQFRQITKLLLSKGIPKQTVLELGMPEWALKEADSKVPPPSGFIED